MKRLRMLLLALGLSPFTGCTGGDQPVAAPAVDPATLASAVLAQYDANKDGYLEGKELEACPALKSALSRLDRDRDQRLSKSELETRFKEYKDSNVGLFTVAFYVTLNGRPLANAAIDLEPEKFMGSTARPASATTDERGRATPETGGVRGCQFGCYRIRVTSRDAGGTPPIPARYNTQTTLGVEIGPQEHGGGRHDLRLSSK